MYTKKKKKIVLQWYRKLPVNKFVRIHVKEFEFYPNSDGHWMGVTCLCVYFSKIILLI